MLRPTAILYPVTSGIPPTAVAGDWFKPFNPFNRCAPFQPFKS
ncbi:MAG TPA: hypothetical protein VFM35_06705 [Candidatus Binatia bacterium]|nr:hypothetical protein [Candidatus Binatia bacterium]